MLFPTGRCSLGFFCKCPTGKCIYLICYSLFLNEKKTVEKTIILTIFCCYKKSLGELRLKNKCAECDRQLHSAIQGCGKQYGEGKVVCYPGTGCRIKSDKKKKRKLTKTCQECTIIPQQSFTYSTPKKQQYNVSDTSPQTIETPTIKKRQVPQGRKRGGKKGTKKEAKLTLEEWYMICRKYRQLHQESPELKQAVFLWSPESGEKIMGTLQQRQTFSRYLRQYDSGKLRPSQKRRNMTRKFVDIERKLINYLDMRERSYKLDKCGISWVVLQNKSLQYADLLGYEEGEFAASPGWIANTLKIYNKISVLCHGESNEMTDEFRRKVMDQWTKEFHKLIDNKKVTPNCVYNADQTGLYYQKLPNRMYVSKENRKKIKGAKQMKSKTRVTVMVCTAADGTKVPLSLVGYSKTPVCFKLTQPPLAYTHQANAWFDQRVTLWWINFVFWPFHLEKNGNVNAILLLDNCSAHKINMKSIPERLTIHFFPPNVTHSHQPADMGMISTLKVGYRIFMLEKLLSIFDVEGGYKWAYKKRSKLPRGLKGLNYGGKAHIIDAMNILKYIWGRDDKYARVDAIKRCWRRSAILPISWECGINNDVGSASVPEFKKKISDQECTHLCNLLSNIKLKCKNNNIDVSKEAYALEGSVIEEINMDNIDMRAMVENWVDIEDDPFIKSSEIDEVIEKLENNIEEDDSLMNEDEEPEEESKDDEKTVKPTTFQELQDSINTIDSYCKSQGMPSEVKFIIQKLEYKIQHYRLSMQKSSPTITRYFT